MLQYLLTGLAGIALGIVAMRVWQAREPGEAAPQPDSVEGAAPETTPSSAPGIQRKLLIGAGGLVAVAVAVLALRSPDAPAASDAPAPMPRGAASGKALDDVDTMINRLAARLEKEPNDGEGFRMLGWSYLMTNRPELAIAPFKRALTLLPNAALVHSGYGEALAGVAKGAVTPEAKAEFDRAVALDPKDPRALYFLALWQAQHGQQKEALEKWIALANSGPADAPWQSDLRRQITDVSGKLGVDVSARLTGPASATAGVSAPPIPAGAMQAASALPASDRQAMVDQMVNGLADKLKANPADVDRWVLLLRSRMVLHQGEQAHGDLVTARKALSSDTAGLAKVNAAARELGIPGA
ncbi:MAG: hypothetical protein KGL44_04155 [Sphingomonadales bacterium]|nr:hypothetical protein [Sphingomonadales bacterium]